MTRYDEARRLESFRHVETHGAAVEARACTWRSAFGQLRDAATRAARWGAELPAIASAALGDRVIAVLVPLLFTGVAGMDMLLARPISGWLAFEFLGEPTWAPLLVWLLPAALVCLDVWIAILLYQMRCDVAEGGPRNWPVILLAVLVLTVLPSFTLATQLAVRPDPESAYLGMFWLRTFALVGASVLLHGAIILSGGLIRTSAEYYAYLTGRGFATWAQRRCRRACDRAERAARSELALYWRLRNEHEMRWPGARFRPLPREAIDLLSQPAHDEQPPKSPVPPPVDSTDGRRTVRTPALHGTHH